MLEKNIYYSLNKKKVFFISFLICLIFYFLEFLIGIDKFYHPDSLHYLGAENHSYLKLNLNSNSIFDFANSGYYYFIKLLNFNYVNGIILNFVLYSLSNVIIFEKVFKNFIVRKDNFDLILLAYLLFLDPYRLHLTCHILKETFIIFIFLLFFVDKLKYLKFLFIILLEFFRKNSFIYLLIFIRFFHLKKFFYFCKKNFKNKKLLFFFTTTIIFICCFLVINYDLAILFERIDWLLNYYHYREMPKRDYDLMNNFQDKEAYLSTKYFYLVFFSKIFLWISMLLSGFFIFFTQSFLFQVLGLIIILNHLVVFKITKKTYIDFGLILLLLAIATYSSSYTSFYRYCYLGLYFSMINFFYNLSKYEK